MQNKTEQRQPVKVDCNRCGKDIFLQQIRNTNYCRVRMEDGERLRLEYFCCPHCGVVYTIALHSTETTKMLNDKRRLESAVAVQRREADRNALLDIDVRYKGLMEELQEKYKGQAYQWADKALDLYVPEHDPEKVGTA